MKIFNVNKLSVLTAAVLMVGSFGVQAATKVIQVRASVDTSLSVEDISGTWDAPIIMEPNADSSGLETVTMTLNFTANNYKDVNVTLQSSPHLVDTQQNQNIPLVFKLGGQTLQQNSAVTALKTNLFEYDSTASQMTGPKNVPLSIESANNGPLQSGNYTGSFVLNFELQP
ncbi:fimbrial protein [Ferrimonas balearica]|uniref:CS1 type fimbrial major subunit n=1 Tax=Ferrimonas balearica TaxID=44012 RepID=UPI001C58FAEC|nr:CS1 type fimbrial major subunit [Ferrimonas balearica]MBW3138383.1 fimbrial protein [Ferrimonas balearica]MBY6105446.1 fimbrial protein [Ferrimonas balearica]